MKWLI